jgi:hypothetical protein
LSVTALGGNRSPITLHSLTDNCDEIVPMMIAEDGGDNYDQHQLTARATAQRSYRPTRRFASPQQQRATSMRVRWGWSPGKGWDVLSYAIII